MTVAGTKNGQNDDRAEMNEKNFDSQITFSIEKRRYRALEQEKYLAFEILLELSTSVGKSVDILIFFAAILYYASKPRAIAATACFPLVEAKFHAQNVGAVRQQG